MGQKSSTSYTVENCVLADSWRLKFIMISSRSEFGEDTVALGRTPKNMGFDILYSLFTLRYLIVYICSHSIYSISKNPTHRYMVAYKPSLPGDQLELAGWSRTVHMIPP